MSSSLQIEKKLRSKVQSVWQELQRCFALTPEQSEEFQGAFGAIQKVLRDITVDGSEAEIELADGEALFRKEPLIPGIKETKGLAKILGDQGIRMLAFRPEVEIGEFKKMIALFKTDFSIAENADEDLYSLLKEPGFKNIDIIPNDLVEEISSQLAQWRRFSEAMLRRSMTVASDAPRQMRPDDLKTIEEFKLNPSVFLKTDEEVELVIKSIGKKMNNTDAQVPAQLIELGFQVVLTARDPKQLSMVREAIVQTIFHSIKENDFDFAESVVKKLEDLKTKHQDRAGELQQVIDAMFQVKEGEFYATLLNSVPTQTRGISLMRLGGGSALQITLNLLPTIPALNENLREIVKNYPKELLKLPSEISREPMHKAWPTLFQILAECKSLYFMKLMGAWIKASDKSYRPKLYRFLCATGIPEGHHAIFELIKSESKEDRMLGYELLGTIRSQNAADLLMARLQSEEVLEHSFDELESCLRSTLKLAGEGAYSIVEKIWNLSSGGFLKRKIPWGRRLAVIKASVAGCPQVLLKLNNSISKNDLKEDELASLSSNVQTAMKQLGIK